jgi:hypothetical protein
LVFLVEEPSTGDLAIYRSPTRRQALGESVDMLTSRYEMIEP